MTTSARQLQSEADLDALDFTRGSGLVTVAAQDARTGALLMVAHADREAMAHTLRSGEMHYRSRSRGLWHKGATSGNVQRVVRLYADCDGDAVLAVVEPAGPACHTGGATCFEQEDDRSSPLQQLDRVIAARARETGEQSTSYTRRLLGDRNLRFKKVAEEAGELVVACADGDREHALEEAADLVYHVLVALRALGGGVDDVEAVLRRRLPPGGSLLETAAQPPDLDVLGASSHP
jgi:phosphoribosyl-ATP pyrophosphohydrolase/phosphoribosyl-AMP cyclohydrolase